MSTARSATPSITQTLTLENTPSSNQQSQETLVLRLNRKKKVSWKEGTINNEFMNKKSSKKCCIFHKEKPFDEDTSDDDDDHDHDKSNSDKRHSHDCCSHDAGSSSSVAN